MIFLLLLIFRKSNGKLSPNICKQWTTLAIKKTRNGKHCSHHPHILLKTQPKNVSLITVSCVVFSLQIPISTPQTFPHKTLGQRIWFVDNTRQNGKTGILTINGDTLAGYFHIMDYFSLITTHIDRATHIRRPIISHRHHFWMVTIERPRTRYRTPIHHHHTQPRIAFTAPRTGIFVLQRTYIVSSSIDQTVPTSNLNWKLSVTVNDRWLAQATPIKFATNDSWCDMGSNYFNLFYLMFMLYPFTTSCTCNCTPHCRHVTPHKVYTNEGGEFQDGQQQQQINISTTRSHMLYYSFFFLFFFNELLVDTILNQYIFVTFLYERNTLNSYGRW